MKYTIRAIIYCLLHLDFKGTYALWDFYWHPEDWKDVDAKKPKKAKRS